MRQYHEGRRIIGRYSPRHGNKRVELVTLGRLVFDHTHAAETFFIQPWARRFQWPDRTLREVGDVVGHRRAVIVDRDDIHVGGIIHAHDLHHLLGEAGFEHVVDRLVSLVIPDKSRQGAMKAEPHQVTRAWMADNPSREIIRLVAENLRSQLARGGIHQMHGAHFAIKAVQAHHNLPRFYAGAMHRHVLQIDRRTRPRISIPSVQRHQSVFGDDRMR